jgi:DNA-directed RNA polymerase specialized sigma24 family protein
VSAAGSRRPRAATPALERTRVRRRLRRALEGCSPVERALLALLIVERLTPAEAAHALRLSTAGVERRYRALLAEMARAYHGLSSRRAARAAHGLLRLRRAS